MKQLSKLIRGECGLLEQLPSDEKQKERLIALGFGKGVEIKFIQKAPLRCPYLFEIYGIQVALRKDLADQILVNVIKNPKKKQGE